jgi:shikimate kinase/3-dehydroquinate synthase
MCSGRKRGCRLEKSIFLYGPSGSGKSTLAERLAAQLGLKLRDLDAEIVAQAGIDIPAIFAKEGEVGFRLREKQVLHEVVSAGPAVVALGGGALLDPESRNLVSNAGDVLCLRASAETLLARLVHEEDRPLLDGDREEQLRLLLEERSRHYDSFTLQLDTENLDFEQAAREAKIALGAFRVQGMGLGYDVCIGSGSLEDLGQAMRDRDLKGPVTVVSDENVAGFYLDRTASSLRKAGYEVHAIQFPAGEMNKTLETVSRFWDAFAQARMERRSTVVALGGGVVGDLAGFAAAAFLRGVPWVNVPTSLLAMVDAGVGGKTGANLPYGKNLIGAFYAPRLVLMDPEMLSTLPAVELRNGLAEVVKTGVIGDPELFARCKGGENIVRSHLDEIVCRSVAVKIEIIEEDPYEKGIREALNLGHTVGHAVEKASDFKLHHGEAVSIGMVAEARISQWLGLAETGLVDQLTAVLKDLGLPVGIPSSLSKDTLVAAMRFDKKRAERKVRFSLPVSVGEVKIGIEIDEAEVRGFLE